MGEVPDGVSVKIGKRVEGGHRLMAEPGEDRDQRERGSVPQARSLSCSASRFPFGAFSTPSFASSLTLRVYDDLRPSYGFISSLVVTPTRVP